ALIAEWTRERDAHAVMRELQVAGIPSGAVQYGEDLFDDPQLRARGAVIGVDHPKLGRLSMADVPVRFGDGRLALPRCAPRLGEHNAYVYCEILGYSPEQLAAWQQAGIVD